MEVGGYLHAPTALSPERDPVPNVQEAEWTPGPVCTDAENPLKLTRDPRNVQPVASRHNDCAIPALNWNIYVRFFPKLITQQFL